MANNGNKNKSDYPIQFNIEPTFILVIYSMLIV